MGSEGDLSCTCVIGPFFTEHMSPAAAVTHQAPDWEAQAPAVHSLLVLEAWSPQGPAPLISSWSRPRPLWGLLEGTAVLSLPWHASALLWSLLPSLGIPGSVSVLTLFAPWLRGQCHVALRSYFTSA